MSLTSSPYSPPLLLPSKALAVNEALFTLNARCGYVLRPQYRPSRAVLAPGPAPGLAPGPRAPTKATGGGFHLRVRVLCATKLPKHGLQAPCVAERWDVYHPTTANFAEAGEVRPLCNLATNTPRT